MAAIHPQIGAYKLPISPNFVSSREKEGENLPVMKLLASLIKNAAAPLYSSGLLNLPNIFCFGQSSLLSGNFSNSASTIAVTI
jgi:hypothetical protein